MKTIPLAKTSLNKESCKVSGVTEEMTRILNARHFFITFYLETEIIEELLSLDSRINLSCLSKGRYIISTDFDDWLNILKKGLVNDSSTELRQLLTSILNDLNTNGFSKQISVFKMRKSYDGTTIIS